MEFERKIILWTYRKVKKSEGNMIAGEHEIRLRLTQFKTVKYISLDYSSNIQNWDEQFNFPKPSHRHYRQIVQKIDALLDEVNFEIKLAAKNFEVYLTVEELKNRVLKKSMRLTPMKILEFFDIVAKEMEDEGRIGYANIFKYCKSPVSKSLNDKDKAFTAYTKSDAESFEKLVIKSNNKQTTNSNYLRTFYRIWNIAIERGYTPNEFHPKKYIKYKPYRKYKTSKRAITFDKIKALENLTFKADSRMFRSQQYFLFSYYARGMNFNDMLKLKHEDNCYGGELHYTRSKNKRRYDFILHTKAVEIIEIFKAYPLQSDAGHIFPVLMAEHNTPKKIDVRIDSALKDLNEDLREMSEMIGLPKHITSYAARHSFATNLRHKNIQIAFIQEAMGHETELQTMTYLEEFDDVLLAKTIEEALN